MEKKNRVRTLNLALLLFPASSNVHFLTLWMKPLCVTMFYKVVLTKFVDQILVCDHSKKAIEQYFYVLL